MYILTRVGAQAQDCSRGLLTDQGVPSSDYGSPSAPAGQVFGFMRCNPSQSTFPFAHPVGWLWKATDVALVGGSDPAPLGADRVACMPPMTLVMGSLSALGWEAIFAVQSPIRANRRDRQVSI